MQLVDRRMHGAQLVDQVAAGMGETVQRVGQRALPAAGVARLRPVVAQRFEQAYELPPATKRGGLGAFRVAGSDASGDHAVAGERVVAQGVGQEQPVQPIGEAVPIGRREIQAAATIGVESPANAGGADPAVNEIKIIGGQSEFFRYRLLLQQREYGAGREAAAGEREQTVQGAGDRIGPRLWQAGDGVGDAAGGRDGAEHRIDQRCRCLEIGYKHQDLVRWWRIDGGKQRQQLVVQHLQLAGQRMAEMDFDAAIVGGEFEAARLEFV